ncbi:hypothetical protein AB0M46_33650 [Dactylosporangium sp. NPDC051485]|uniref:hypothetical protein n=1 Tax=Dactylosporangium sp. NPDC051485 TaxID=3154846 RepID=UPI0034404C89
MTDVDAIREQVLVPLPLNLDVTPVVDAADDLVTFGQLYWEPLGVDADTNRVVWRHPLTVLYRELGVSIRRSHTTAAAGVRATATDLTCPVCGGPMTFRAREDLERYVRDEALTRCAGCDPQLIRGIALERTDEAAQRRAEQRSRAQHDLAIHQAQKAWEQAQRDHIAAGHPTPEPRRDRGRRDARLLGELVTLTLLRHRPNEPIVAPVNTWDLPLAPSTAMSEMLLNDCLNLGRLSIHPESPTHLCRWRETFTAALMRADNDPSRIGQPECDGCLVGWAAWQLPTATSDAAANKQLNADLTQRFALDQLSPADRSQLFDLAIELIAAETVRAFESGIHDADLPPVPAEHRPTLESAALSLARLNDLHECLAHADAAVYYAEKAARANPKARRVNMTVHGVNRLADSAQDWYLIPILDQLGSGHTGRNDLSALTWVLFRSVLGIDPLTGSHILAATVLAAAQDHHDTTPAELDEQVGLILDLDLRTDPHRVYRALQQTVHHQHPTIAVAAESLVELVDRLRTATGDLRGALAAAVAATRLLRTPVILPRSATTVLVGEHLTAVMVQAATSPPET